MGNENSSGSNGEYSGAAAEMFKNKFPVDYAPKIKEDGVAPATRATKVNLNDKLGDHPSASTGAKEALADDSLSFSINAPTEEDEALARSTIDPVADRVLEKSEMHYNMLYGIVTQMQRDRLGLGPEVSDYEVIVKAHADYNAADDAEAAALSNAAELHQVKALAHTLRKDLLAAQSRGLRITPLGGLNLTQDVIASLLARCEELCNSSSAAKEYLALKAMEPSDLYIDPTTAENLKNTICAADFVGSGGDGGNKRRKCNNKTVTWAPSSYDAGNSLKKLKKNIKVVEAFSSRLVNTTPRDFTTDIEKIEREFAQLMAHRAKAPGGLVPDSVGGGEGGIRVDADDVGEGGKHDDAKDNREGITFTAGSKKMPRSRAEERRLAREKAKGKRRATE